MLLIKLCSENRHIRNGTLRLGTLAYYRETELSEIVDKEEGMLRFHINFDGEVTISTAWFNTFAQGGMQFGDTEPIRFPGKTNAWFTKIRSKNQGDLITLTDSIATIERESPNSFVFCMSLVESMNESERRFQSYDSHWSMKLDSAQKFAIQLAHLILEKIGGDRDLGIFTVPQYTDLTKLEIFYRWDLVRYLERDIHINNMNIPSLANLIKDLEDTAFIKPMCYEPEQEFRFHFTLIYQGQIIEPSCTGIIVNAEKLKQFVT